VPPYRQDCDCRKPRPGMLLRAARDLGIDLNRSYMVGDGLVDVEAGSAAGVVPILVLTGYGRGHFEHRRSRWRVGRAQVGEDLRAGVDWILAREGARGASLRRRVPVGFGRFWAESPPSRRWCWPIWCWTNSGTVSRTGSPERHRS